MAMVDSAGFIRGTMMPEKNTKGSTAVNAGSFFQFFRDISHKTVADHNGHGQRKRSIGKKQGSKRIQHMERTKNQKYREQHCMNGNRQSQHEKVIDQFPAFKQEPGYSVGSCQGDDDGEKNRDAGYQNTVEKISVPYVLGQAPCNCSRPSSADEQEGFGD